MRTIDSASANEPEVKDLSNITTLINEALKSAQPFMPEDVQKNLTQQLSISKQADAVAARAYVCIKTSGILGYIIIIIIRH